MQPEPALARPFSCAHSAASHVRDELPRDRGSRSMNADERDDANATALARALQDLGAQPAALIGVRGADARAVRAEAAALGGAVAELDEVDVIVVPEALPPDGRVPVISEDMRSSAVR